MNLDGTQLETLVSNIHRGPVGLGIDPLAQKVYWAQYNFNDPNGGGLQRANLDGSEVETLAAGFNADSLALDLEHRKIYWSRYEYEAFGGIWRANLDGSAIEMVDLGGINPRGIAIVSSGAPACPGDIDGDGATGQADLGILLAHYGLPGGPEAGDLTGDGLVDQADLAVLLADYGCGA
jgi:hypothetical protein